MLDCVVWYNGSQWSAALDTSELHEPGSGDGALADFAPMTNFRHKRQHGVFSSRGCPACILPSWTCYYFVLWTHSVMQGKVMMPPACNRAGFCWVQIILQRINCLMPEPYAQCHNTWHLLLGSTELRRPVHVCACLTSVWSCYRAEDSCNFALNIYDMGNVLSIVVDSGSHGTHVAGITSAYHEAEPHLNGIAPGWCWETNSLHNEI